MPRPRLSRLIRAAGLACLLAGSSMAAWAGPQAGRQGRAPPQQRSDEVRRAPPQAHDRRDGQRALAEAVRRAERATRGQVLSAERVQYDGRDLNRVKLVDDRGRVRVYWDDPATGDARDRGEDGGRKGRGNAPRTRDDDDRSD